MKYYDKIRQLYMQIEDNENRRICLAHHQRVLDEIETIMKLHNIDDENYRIAAYMHDIALYTGKPFNHAENSAIMSENYLRMWGCEEKDIQIITKMIRRHSDKKHMHDFEDECLKQADIKAKQIDF